VCRFRKYRFQQVQVYMVNSESALTVRRCNTRNELVTTPCGDIIHPRRTTPYKPGPYKHGCHSLTGNIAIMCMECWNRAPQNLLASTNGRWTLPIVKHSHLASGTTITTCCDSIPLLVGGSPWNVVVGNQKGSSGRSSSDVRCSQAGIRTPYS
jgi:hypothetical protein